MATFLEAILWSLAACGLFGVCNFILAYTVSIPRCDYMTNSGLIWLSCGFCGLVVYALSPGRFAWKTVPNCPGLTYGLARVAAIGGLGVGCAQLFTQLAFQEDPQAAGPLSSVVCGDVIVVSVYCHFVYGGTEQLNRTQWLAVFGLFGGLCLIAQPRFESVDSGEGVGLAMVYAIFAMLAFSVSVVAVRWSFEPPHLSTSQGGFVLRMAAMAVGGCVCLLAAAWRGTLKHFLLLPGNDVSLLLALPCACGLLQSMGVYAINQALQYPSTGVCIAIFGSNSVVVLVLDVLVQGHMPVTTKLYGMALTVASCSLVSLAAAQDVEGIGEGYLRLSPKTSPKNDLVYERLCIAA